VNRAAGGKGEVSEAREMGTMGVRGCCAGVGHLWESEIVCC